MNHPMKGHNPLTESMDIVLTIFPLFLAYFPGLASNTLYSETGIRVRVFTQHSVRPSGLSSVDIFPFASQEISTV